MSRVATRVYTNQDDLVRLQAISLQLPQDQRVQITLQDGSRLTGIVSAVPVMQAFFDSDGREGTNALVKLERTEAGDCMLWLDEIDSVTHLPNPSPPQPTDAWPPDPNAPVVE